MFTSCRSHYLSTGSLRNELLSSLPTSGNRKGPVCTNSILDVPLIFKDEKWYCISSMIATKANQWLTFDILLQHFWHERLSYFEVFTRTFAFIQSYAETETDKHYSICKSLLTKSLSANTHPWLNPFPWECRRRL